jgi:endonuclease III
VGLLAATEVIETLERAYGRVRVPKRVRAFDMLVRLLCGYPTSEDNCAKGWDALAAKVGTGVADILSASARELATALRAGGAMAELRASRLQALALAVSGGADLASRKTLLKLPTIGEPGADAILLMTRVEQVAAVPSNATQVPVRLGFGTQERSYTATYRSAKQALDGELPRDYDARIRAYLVLKRHGQTVCKRTRPRCELCPLAASCPSFAAARAT